MYPVSDVTTTPIVIHANRWRGVLMDARPAILVAVGISLAITGAYLRFNDDYEGLTDLLLLAGIVVMFGAACWDKASKRVRRVELYQDGFIWSDGTDHYAEWDEIEKFCYARPRDIFGQWRSPIVTIEFFDGGRIQFDSGLQKLPNLAGFVRAATLEHLLTLAETDLSLGPVRFGPVMASADGLSIDDWTLKWHEINCVMEGGSLVIAPETGRDAGFAIPLSDIPNVGVLTRLMAKRKNPPLQVLDNRPTQLVL
jgi:hypothetical protein